MFVCSRVITDCCCFLSVKIFYVEGPVAGGRLIMNSESRLFCICLGHSIINYPLGYRSELNNLKMLYYGYQVLSLAYKLREVTVLTKSHFCRFEDCFFESLHFQAPRMLLSCK